MNPLTQRAVIDILSRQGLYQHFECSYCAARDNLITGPHSHVCEKCGGKAVYGWYTSPRCEGCK